MRAELAPEWVRVRPERADTAGGGGGDKDTGTRKEGGHAETR